MLYVKLPITTSVRELCDDSFVDRPSVFHLLQLQDKTAPNVTRPHQTLQDRTKRYKTALNVTRPHQTLQDHTKRYKNALNVTRPHQTLQDRNKRDNNSSGNTERRTKDAGS